MRANSWIELRSPGGDVLAQTYVRAGESYIVPAGIAYRVIDARCYARHTRVQLFGGWISRPPAEYIAAAMSIRPYRDIVRRKSRQVMVGSVPVGGDAPITVQTMTNTLTADAEATIAQIQPLRGGRRRHRPRLLPGRGLDGGAAQDRQGEPGADRGRHPLPL